MAKKAMRILPLIFSILLALFAVGLAFLRIMGYGMFTVLSGSMEPGLPVGALICTKPENDYAPGQVITFLIDDDTAVTHRIVEVVPCQDGVTRFRTQGDANASPDAALVHPQNILGTPFLVIPRLGYAVTWLKTRYGQYVLLALVLCGIISAFLPERTPAQSRDMAGNSKKYP